jgi:ketosteroid isomerase-like protein
MQQRTGATPAGSSSTPPRLWDAVSTEMSESPELIALARTFTEALNARDIEALISCCNPHIEFHSTFAAVGGAVYQGHEGMRRWFQDLEDAWGKDLQSEIEAFFDPGGGALLVFYVLRGRGRQSGAEVTLPAASVLKARDGLIIYFKAYVHREDAFRELGVTEDALEPIAS